MSWLAVGEIHDIPARGSRTVETPMGRVALFRTHDDGIFALLDACPHKGGPLSQGIVHGNAVTCPLHSWVIDLETGEARAPDSGCARKLGVRLAGAQIELRLAAAALAGAD